MHRASARRKDRRPLSPRPHLLRCVTARRTQQAGSRPSSRRRRDLCWQWQHRLAVRKCAQRSHYRGVRRLPRHPERHAGLWLCRLPRRSWPGSKAARFGTVTAWDLYPTVQALASISGSRPLDRLALSSRCRPSADCAAQAGRRATGRRRHVRSGTTCDVMGASPLPPRGCLEAARRLYMSDSTPRRPRPRLAQRAFIQSGRNCAAAPTPARAGRLAQLAGSLQDSSLEWQWIDSVRAYQGRRFGQGG